MISRRASVPTIFSVSAIGQLLTSSHSEWPAPVA